MYDTNDDEIPGPVNVGSVVRAEDGRRFIIKSIRKADDGKEPSMMHTTSDDDEIAKLEQEVAGLEKMLASAIGKADEAVDDGDDVEPTIASLQSQVAELGKTLTDAIAAADNESSFERVADDVQKRDGCSRTQALQRARTEAPDAFIAYQRSGVEIAKAGPAQDRISGPPSKFDSLVNQIMATERKPRIVAMQLARKRDPAAFAKYQSE